jgi:hypothetical protein
MKVYCTHCKHEKTYEYGTPDCKYPDNIKTLDTHARQVTYYRDQPQDLNANNDCKWFEWHWFYKLLRKLRIKL